MLAGTVRELTEETGIAGTPWPVDLSGRWATWALTVPRNTPVVLDAEHDGYAWVSAAYPDAPRFPASPDHRNRASLRLLDKLGFRQGLWIDEPATSEYDPPETEIVCTLDVAHWYG